MLLGVLAYHQTGMLDFSFAALQQHFDWHTVIVVALIICLFIFLGSLYKIMSLSQGGVSVAELLGGQLVPRSSTDAAERRLLNVVEEMAIAAGITVPRVYLLDEMGINAFAAGTSPNNAVIGVTRGALKHLNRDELQGVIAHEFSHIFNGDMRLNIRLMGGLHGILLLGMTGYYLLRVTRYVGRSRSSKGGNAAVLLLVLGIGLVAIGYIGFFFGQWIKSMVSRQREFLADASAVRYTRNQQGIADALKKIGGMGSTLINPAAAEYSHAYFSQGVSSVLEFMFATHPPLARRIRSIEPRWDGKYILPRIPKPEPKTPAQAPAAEDKQAKLTNVLLAGAIAAGVLSADEIIEQVGTVSDEQMALAQQIIAAIPVALREAAAEPFGARAVIYGVLMDWRAAVAVEQQSILKQLADPAVANMTQQLEEDRKALPEFARLPLLELTLPALQELSINQYQQFRSVVQALISADKKVDLKEWIMQRLVIQQLDEHFGLRKPARAKHAYLGAVKNEAEILLSLVAYTEHPDDAHAGQAFEAGKQAIGTTAFSIVPREELSLAKLNGAIDKLEQLKPVLKSRILKAITASIMHDGKATIKGQELLRTIASCLNCPIPPLGVMR